MSYLANARAGSWGGNGAGKGVGRADMSDTKRRQKGAAANCAAAAAVAALAAGAGEILWSNREAANLHLLRFPLSLVVSVGIWNRGPRDAETMMTPWNGELSSARRRVS